MAGITKNVFQFSLDGKFVKEWKSASDAARELGVTPQGIYECLKERFVAYGYIWLRENNGDKALQISNGIDISNDTLQGEVWKNVVGYKGYYQVSNLGRIRTVGRVVSACYKSRQFIQGRIICPNRFPKGYLGCTLYKSGSQKLRYIHRLVAEAFIPNPQNLPQVNHKDENKSNNRVDNLEWCTQEYNTNYGTCTQRISNAHKALQKGKRVVQIDKCSQIIIATYPNSAIAMEQTGIDASAIKKVCLNRPKFKTAGGYIWRRADDIPDKSENNNSHPKQLTTFDL